MAKAKQRPIKAIGEDIAAMLNPFRTEGISTFANPNMNMLAADTGHPSDAVFMMQFTQIENAFYAFQRNPKAGQIIPLLTALEYVLNHSHLDNYLARIDKNKNAIRENKEKIKEPKAKFDTIKGLEIKKRNVVNELSKSVENLTKEIDTLRKERKKIGRKKKWLKSRTKKHEQELERLNSYKTRREEAEKAVQDIQDDSTKREQKIKNIWNGNVLKASQNFGYWREPNSHAEKDRTMTLEEAIKLKGFVIEAYRKANVLPNTESFRKSMPNTFIKQFGDEESVKPLIWEDPEKKPEAPQL